MNTSNLAKKCGLITTSTATKSHMFGIGVILLATMLFGNPIMAKEETLPSVQGAQVNNNQARVIEWEDLMPTEDLELLESMTPIDHAALTKKELAKDKPLPKNSLITPNSASRFEATPEAAGAAQKPKKRTWRDALVSTITRPEFNNQKIKIGGYIVPLEYNRQHKLTDFFLVPYFGACIHVPPPPPNQIIYVRIPKGLPPQEIYTPFWVVGTLKVETMKKDLGISSYSLDADSVAVYKDE